MSKLETKFAEVWERYSNASPQPVREYRFHTTRKFRFDFAWPRQRVALELQGYGYGHQSIKGMSQDCDKHNLATYEGWLVLYFTSRHLSTEEGQKQAVALIEYLLRRRSKRLKGEI